MKQKKAPDTQKSSGQFAKTALVLASTAAAIWAIWTLPVAMAEKRMKNMW